MRTVFLSLFALGLTSFCFAQAPDTVWTATFGGASLDRLYDVIQTEDDGYLLIGYTESYGAGDRDVWIVKTNSTGDFSWYSTFGGSSDDRGYSAIQTSDGGYLVAGLTSSYGSGGFDFWLIKTDSSGDLEWEKTYGGSGYDVAFAVVEASSGGYAVCGVTDSYGAGDYDIWFIKTDTNGNVEWDKTYGGSGDDRGRDVYVTSDGGFVLTGLESSGAGDYDVWLAKTDDTGNIEWESNTGGSGDDIGRSVIQTSDGGFILSGDTDSYGSGATDIWLLKASSTCVIEWSETFGGTDSEYGYDVQVDSDGGYLISGYTESYGAGGNDVWLLKTDTSGDLLWDLTLGTEGSDVGRAMQVTADNAYAIGAYTNSFGAGSNDFWLIKTEPEIGIADDERAGVWIPSFAVEPNPFASQTTISFQLTKPTQLGLEIYDILGRMVSNPSYETYGVGSHSVSIDGSSLAPGVYMVILNDGGLRQVIQRVVAL